MAGEGEGKMDRADRVKAMAQAMGDPVRAKILFAVAEASMAAKPEPPGPGISVREISARVAEPPRRVRYHLERLVDDEFVAVTDGKTRRGVVERYYGATEAPIISLESTVRQRVSIEAQRRLTLEILKAIFADARSALAAGTYNSRPEWVAARLCSEVDEQGWEELSVIQETALADAQKVLERAQGRSGTADSRFPVVVAQLLFEAGPR